MSNEVFSSQNQLESLSREIGFDVPVELVSLPSKGLIYPEGHALYNEQAIEIKCMTAKEEDLLTSRALIKNGTVISQLLKSCILNKTIDPDDMLTGDRNALLIAIRVTGYGAEYKAKLECSACEEDYENEFSLSGLKVKSLTATPLQLNTNLFEYISPSGLRIQFKLLTGKDELEISKITEKRKKIQSQVDNMVTSRLFHSIISINGETDRAKLSRIVNNMRALDSRAFRKHMDDIEPDVDMKQSATCPHCSESTEVKVPLGISFFWPDLGD